ncbi:MAG: hypothetical protein EON60_12350 [Alphaproteobacteria bacterium]|nr:MAG: hypothetical protein EON60_12350 [Alphaproteobacteria bacterium]
MRRAVPLYHVFCVYRETPDDTEKTTSFGLVDNDLLAEVMVGFLNDQTPEECMTLQHLAEWRVEHDIVNVFPFQPVERYADCMVCSAFEWLGLNQSRQIAA